MVRGRVGADRARVCQVQLLAAAVATVALLGGGVEVGEDGGGREDLLVQDRRVLTAAEGEGRPHRHHVHHRDVTEGQLDGGVRVECDLQLDGERVGGEDLLQLLIVRGGL